jgi:hypothetical protein
VGTLRFAHPTPSQAPDAGFRRRGRSEESCFDASLKLGLVGSPPLALKGIELFENATRNVSTSDTLARERRRAPALQIFIALLRGDGSPEFGECDEDESEARPMAGLDVNLQSARGPLGHRRSPVTSSGADRPSG